MIVTISRNSIKFSVKFRATKYVANVRLRPLYCLPLRMRTRDPTIAQCTEQPDIPRVRLMSTPRTSASQSNCRKNNSMQR